MKFAFYPRLALDGIRKNKRLYFPYILTCVGMVMMFYIIHYLAAMRVLKHMAGGRTAAQMLGFGTWIVALFALIFLFYTNSFLMRRRRKEFGLYNILGMGKRNLSRMLLWETLILFAVSMAFGLLGGIALSKLAELCLTRILGGEVTYAFTVSREAVWDTFLIFVPIFALIFLKSLAQLWRMSAVSLLRSESVGEKPPKANYLLGIGGIVLLAGAYYIAVSITSPLMALSLFFIAVAMVIVATYLIFISGSVMLCRLLQKNKKFYYQKNHFVPVASMAYRMKRNGAGLASICILSTMVLVMMLGSASLYFGTEDSLRTRFPKDICVTVDYLAYDDERGYSEEKAEKLLHEIHAIMDDFGVTPQNEQFYRRTAVTGLLRDGRLTVNPNEVERFSTATYDYVCNLIFVPLADYNRCMGTSETLESNQVLLHCIRRSYDDPVISMDGGTCWQVKKQVDDIMDSGDAAMDVIPSVYIVVAELEPVIDVLSAELGEDYAEFYCRSRLSYIFDTDQPGAEKIALGDAIRQRIRDMDISGEGGFYASSTECREEEREDFYGTYGGIFFLGILLSIVFLLATVLIIYYKQVSEGYEDQSRFEIMQKVGMTRQDIRKSINSQMMTVFFLPLVTAALHLGFAFPMVQKLLALFNLRNVPLMGIVMAVSMLVFGIFYAIIYKVTSHAYLSIVSGAKDV
ncbi:MAG: FtsX-like permease family protein [Faecousia sp.]